MLKLRTVILSGLFIVALTASAQLSFGVKAGLNMSSISDVEDSKMKIGYKVGPMAEISLPGSTMGVQAALLLSSKGVKADGFDAQINANYLELPITFVYKFPLAFDTNLYVDAGPYFAYGIFGKSDISFEGVSLGVDTFSDDFGMKKFDTGLTIGAGMEVAKFNFGLNYDLGLTKVFDEGDGKNGNFWISLGYKF